MDKPTAIAEVLSAYAGEYRPSHVEPFLGGGFSGAKIWKLQTDAGPLCLRRWPAEHPSQERLEFIQAVLMHVNRRGFRLAPAPIPTLARRGYVVHQQRFWELTPWLPGTADYQAKPSPKKLAAALTSLAEFHRAAESYLFPGEQLGTSPSLAQRLALLVDLKSGGAARLRAAVRPGDWPELTPHAERLLSLFPAVAESVQRELSKTAASTIRLQPAIRDIWREHVLFTGDNVTGLIDYGALRIESVAADVARLVGSLALDDRASWNLALAAYEAIRPLSAQERQLVEIFDRSSVLLSGLQWLTWIYQEQRTFERRAAVEARLDEILARLEGLAADVR